MAERPPYGYRIIDNPDGNGKILDVDPEISEVVREAVRRVIEGQSVTSIAADFNARAILPPRGEKLQAAGNAAVEQHLSPRDPAG